MAAERSGAPPPYDRLVLAQGVGGGATGVEMAGSLAEMKSEALPVVYP